MKGTGLLPAGYRRNTNAPKQSSWVLVTCLPGMTVKSVEKLAQDAGLLLTSGEVTGVHMPQQSQPFKRVFLGKPVYQSRMRTA